MNASDAPVVRPARPDDTPAILHIWRAAVEATHGFLTADDVDWYGGLVVDIIPRVPGLRVAVDADDRPLGFIAAEDGTVQMLFVAPEVHGRGIGTALLDDAVAAHEEVRVDVNEQNPSGRRFYEGRGFVEVGRDETDDQGRPFPILHLVRRARGTS